MQVLFQDGRYIALDPTEEEAAALQNAKWSWNPKLRQYTTRRLKTAETFKEHAVGEARSRLCADDASRAVEADIDVPAPAGRHFRSFQLAGIQYALDRSDTLIADPCGVGKTVQAIGVANASTPQRVLLVVPASLKYKWAREWQDWCVHRLSVGFVEVKTRQQNKKKITENIWPDTDVVIINPELLPRHLDKIHDTHWDILVVDEAHSLGSPTSQRTRNILGGSEGRGKKKKVWYPIPASQRLFLTATPMDITPIKLWPLVQACDPTGLGKDYYAFAKKYCGAYKAPFGFVTNGATNLEELNRRLRASFMIRRDKLEVMKDLPSKSRMLVELPDDGITAAIKKERNAIASALEQFEGVAGAKPAEEYSDEVVKEMIRLEGSWLDQVGQLSPAEQVAFEEISIVRRMLAEAKVKMVVDYVRRLRESESKVVVMGFHTALLEQVAAAFDDSVLIIGSTAAKTRDDRVQAFQNDPSVGLAVGNFLAAGVGIDLFAASHLVMAEASWVSWQCEQAEDRVWRMGQDRPCMVHYLVVRGSLEARIVERFVDGELVAQSALD